MACSKIRYGRTLRTTPPNMLNNILHKKNMKNKFNESKLLSSGGWLYNQLKIKFEPGNLIKQHLMIKKTKHPVALLTMKLARHFVFILGVVLVSCTAGNQPELVSESATQRVINVNLIDNLNNTVPEFYLSDVADSLELVQVEMNPKYIFNEEEISNLRVTPEFIFFYTYKTGLLQYSRSGKFLRQIGRIGKGPGEYSLLRNFSINDDQRTISAYCNNTNVHLYDFDGNFLKTSQPRCRGTREFVSVHQFGGYFLFEQSPFVPETSDTSQIYNFALTDSLLNEVEVLSAPSYKNRKVEILANRYDPHDSWANFYYPAQPIKKLNSTYMDFLYYGADTIQRLTNKLELETRYVLNTGEKMPFDVLHYRCHPYEYFDYILVTDFVETPRYLFLDFGYKKQKYMARFRKSDGYTDVLVKDASINEKYVSGHLYTRRREGPSPYITNDLIGTGAFKVDYADEHKWASVFPAYKLMEFNADSVKQATVKYPILRDEFLSTAKNVSENDGPLILIAHLKASNEEI